jgi:hypothetical protein
MAEYIKFSVILQQGKTGVWLVQNKRYDSDLGWIRWHGIWRQYCFFPAVGCIFSAGCLFDIQEFINQQMAARRKAG